MAITEEGGGIPATMLVGPTGGYGGGFGNGFGGDWAWIILLLVLCGGWGNGFGGGFGGGDMYPWLNNSNQINDGFRDQMMFSNVTSIGDKLVSGQMDAMQMALGLQNQISSCCCDTRAGIADLRYTIANEECATRSAAAANTQRILDQMCADKIDAKNERIAELERQLTMAQLAASQGAQTAAIIANNEAQTVALERYLAPTPVPAYVVQNPNCCQNNYGCGGSGF